MIADYEITGVKKAAALLIALGPEIASEIFSYLDEDTIEKISGEIAKTQGLYSDDREELIGEFINNLKKLKNNSYGGEAKAKDLLVKAFGRDRADDLLKKLTIIDVDREFSYFKNAEPEILASLLVTEHEQTTAVTLALLPPEISGRILRIFSPDLAKRVAVKMARTGRINPEAAAQIARKLKSRYKEILAKRENAESSGGVGTLADILSYMKSEDERKLMNFFDASMPGLSTQIRNTLFNFENISNLTNIEVRILIDEIKDDDLLAKALKGAGDEARFKILRNMSQNRATDIINTINMTGPLKISDVEKCRDEIVLKMRNLNDRGLISLKKDGEIYID